MADIAWPSHLPRPLADGYLITLLPAVQTAEVEAGPPLQWQAYTTDYRTAELTLYKISEAEFLAFDRWYHGTIKNGSLAFDIQLPDGRQDDWWEARVVDVWSSDWSLESEVTVTIRLLLTGEPFASRGPVTLSLAADAALTMRAVGSADIRLSLHADASLRLTAVPLDNLPLVLSGDAALRMSAAGALNSGAELVLQGDAWFAMNVSVAPESRETDDGDDRITDDGQPREVG